VADFRLRVCFSKKGRLRYLSHLEVAHALERAIRRADLSYAVTKGFSPHMKIAFGPALPVGTAGMREYMDVYLRGYTDPEEALRLLRDASPEDLVPVEAWYVGDREPALAAVATIATYEVEIAGSGVTEQEVQAALDSVMERGELIVEHKGKQKVFDLARSIPKEPRARSSSKGVAVELVVRMGQQGSLRPDALLTAALPAIAQGSAVASVTRTDVLVESEEGVWARPV